MSAICFIASAAVMLGTSSDGSGDIVIIGVLFIGSSLLFPTVYNVLKYRIRYVDKRTISTFKREANIDIKLRLLMNCLTGDDDELDQEARYKREMARTDMEAIFKFNSKTLKESLKFNQLWSTYSLLFKHNRFLAMTKLRQVLFNNSFIFDILPIQTRLRIFAGYQMVGESNDEDLLCYEEQVRLERIATDSMAACYSNQIRFWKLLISEEYDFDKLEIVTHEFYKQSNLSRKTLQRMVTLDPNSAVYRRRYSEYLLHVVYDEEAAKRQIMRATELETEDQTSYSLTDSGNCILVVSGEIDRIGCIMEANNRSAEVFGYSSGDMLGRNINFLMARPYVAGHNLKILSYINKKQTQLLNFNKTLILRNSKGLAIEGVLQLREYPNFTLAPSITFLGAIKPLDTGIFCVFQAKDMMICDVSTDFHDFFNTDLQAIKNLELRITAIFPGMEKRIPAIDRELENNVEYLLSTRYRMHRMLTEIDIAISFLPYLPREYYKLRIVTEFRYEGDMGQNEVKISSENVANEMIRALNGVNMESRVSPSNSGSSSSSSGGSSTSSESGDTKVDEENIPGESDEDLIHSTRQSTTLLQLGLKKAFNTLEPRIKRMGLLLYLLLALLCLMGVIVQVLWTALTINRFEASIDLITIPMRRSATEGSYSAEMYDHIFRGSFFNSTSQVDAEVKRLHVIVESFRKRTTSLRNVIFNARNGITEQELANIIDAEFYLINFHGDLTLMNMHEAVHLYNMAFTTILNSDLDQLQRDTRIIPFLRANKKSNIPDIWNKACLNILDIQRQSSDRVQQIEFSFMLAALSLVCVSFVLLFLPTLNHTLQLKLEVYKIMEALNNEDMKELALVSRLRLCELRDDNFERNLIAEDFLLFNSKEAKKSHKKRRKEKYSENRLRIKYKHIFRNREMGFLAVLGVLTLLYFLGYYLWWAHMRRTFFDDVSTRIYNSQNRNWFCRKIVENAVNWDDANSTLSLDLAEIEEFEKKIRKVNHALYYGDPEWGISSDILSLEGGQVMFSGNICDKLQKMKQSLYNTTGCESYHEGVLTRGSYEMYMAFVLLSEKVRSLYQVHGVEGALPFIHQLRQFADNWIPQVASIFDLWLFNLFKGGFTTASIVRSVGTVSYIIACFLLGVFVYLPMLIKLNRDVQITRSMLGIIPPETVDKLQRTRVEVRRLAIRIIRSH
jgi:PAS domain S-box-containing protein